MICLVTTWVMTEAVHQSTSRWLFTSHMIWCSQCGAQSNLVNLIHMDIFLPIFSYKLLVTIGWIESSRKTSDRRITDYGQGNLPYNPTSYPTLFFLERLWASNTSLNFASNSINENCYNAGLYEAMYIIYHCRQRQSFSQLWTHCP